MDVLNLKIVTPEKEIYNDKVDMVTVPASKGPVGILPHHTELMTRVTPGELIIKKGGKVDFLAVGEGLLQVSQNDVLVMTDLARSSDEISEKEVEEARERALEALRTTTTDKEYAATMAALEKTVAQLRVKRRRRS